MERDASVEPRRHTAASHPPRRLSGEAANTPERYDLLLAKLADAEAAMEDPRASGRNVHLEAASTIVFGLLNSLDFKHGGEIVPRLAGIYGYLGNELLAISNGGEVEELGHLRDIITTLRASWVRPEDRLR